MRVINDSKQIHKIMIKHLKSIIIIAMVALVSICGTTSCKSSGKLSKKEYKAKVEQAKRDLNAILNNETEWTLEEQQARVNEIKKVDFSKKVGGGFSIGPKDGSWFVSLTDETFRELIAEYLRPVTRKLLFG